MIRLLLRAGLLRVVDARFTYAGEKPIAKLYIFNVDSEAYESPKPRLRIVQ